MLKINPAIKVCRLADLEPGSIIRYHDDVAICLDGSRKPIEKLLALYEAEGKRFVVRVAAAETEVVHFSKDIYLDLIPARSAEA